MVDKIVAKIADLSEVTLEKSAYAPMIDAGIANVIDIKRKLAADQTLRFALLAGVNLVNATLMAASSKCTIGGSPADIDMVPNGQGDLIYQCHHVQPHRWDLSGTRLP